MTATASKFEPAALFRHFVLVRWLRLADDRARCVQHFIGIAVMLAIARVFLNTVAVALFLANEGPAELPRFFMLLALVTIALSTILGLIIDRAPKLSLARVVLGLIMVAGGVGKLLIMAKVPGTYFIILFSAYVLEIAIEIVFWAACAAYLDAVEFKRATPVICLAVAFGGALGGLFARALAWTIETPDMLLIMIPFAVIAGAQLGSPAGFGELRDRKHGVSNTVWSSSPAGLLRIALRYPLLLLVALNALTLTILYGIAEFLFLSIYAENFPSEQELTRFLGIVFAMLQVFEFLLLASFSRVLLERAGPLLRNLVFPVMSLACLLYLAYSNKLSAAVITHLNADAASNAIFLPVHNANFLALPLGIQGRARTLSEGVFYPAGLAIAGALLWSVDATGAAVAAEFVAVLFALVFISINIGVGVLFLPTLIASVRTGVVPLVDLTERIVALPAAASDRVRELLRSSSPERRLDGIALTRWLGPAHVANDLAALASHPDISTRRALVDLAIEDHGPWVRHFVDAAFSRDDRSSIVAMQVMLARGESPTATQATWLVQSKDPSISALAGLLVGGSDPSADLERLAPLLDHPQVASDVAEGIIAARREDCIAILVAVLPAAHPEQQRQALAFLRLDRARTTPSQWRVLGRFVRHRDPWVRAEAMALLGRCHHRATLRALSRGLADRSPVVRGRTADALVAQGDHAIDCLRARLLATTFGSIEAAGALSRMNTERARRALSGSLRRLRRDAADNARLLGQLSTGPDLGPFLGLAACVRDHQARIIEIAVAVLRGSLQRHVFGHVRDALRSEDRTMRANAFEILATATRSGIAADAVETLRVVLFESESSAPYVQGVESFNPWAAWALAQASPDPWVRGAARIVQHRIVADGFGPAPGSARTSPAIAGSQEMNLSEQDLERVLALKRIPLFRYLPLDTLLAVSRSVDSRRYLPGEVIASRRERVEHCLILEAGVISIDRGGTTEPLAAPACLNELVLVGEVMPSGRIVALEPCRILFMHAVVLQDLSRDHPEILMELCRILARRIRAAEDTHRGQPVPTRHSREGLEHPGQPPCAEPENSASEVDKSRRGTKRIFKLLQSIPSKLRFNNE